MESIKPTKKRSKIARFLTSPFRMLNKIYMASVSSCAAGIEHHGGMLTTGSVTQPAQLPRNFSVSSTKGSGQDQEVKELIRVASTRINNNNSGGNSNKVHDIKNLERQGTISMQYAGVVGRSQSVGIGKLGKIDEDVATEFGDGEIKVVHCPRSKTYSAPSDTKNHVLRLEFSQLT